MGETDDPLLKERSVTSEIFWNLCGALIIMLWESASSAKRTVLIMQMPSLELFVWKSVNWFSSTMIWTSCVSFHCYFMHLPLQLENDTYGRGKGRRDSFQGPRNVKGAPQLFACQMLMQNNGTIADCKELSHRAYWKDVLGINGIEPMVINGGHDVGDDTVQGTPLCYAI